MFVRIAAAALASISMASCAAQPQAQAASKTAENVNDGSAWSPYPGASKDAKFLKATPAEFLPFVKACNPWDEWDKPAPPFKIHGNTYYVGTCGIGAILIVGDDGHVLIDTGTRKGAEVVAANVRTLGFKLEDVAVILHSHEHYDHVGGFAWMREQTGAEILASPEAAKVLESGVAAAEDPQFEMHEPMAPVTVANIVEGGDVVAGGSISLTPVRTPGHSPGALSWQWKSCEGDVCLNIVYADSLSPVSRNDYKFSEHPEYLTAYEAGLERLARVDCDILITPHPSHSRLLKRMRNDTMVEPTACAYYAIGKFQDLEKRLKKESAEPDAE